MAHPLIDLVLSSVVSDNGALVFPDAAVEKLAVAYAGYLVPEEAAAASAALVEVAMFLDTQQKAPDAARTVLTLLFAASPALKRLDAAAAQKVDASRAKLGAFQGDARVTRVLDSGARPEGTVAASPLARFQMHVPPKKP